MSGKWMRHSQHGTMVVFDPMTEEVCRRNGWVEGVPPTVQQKPPEPPPLPPLPVFHMEQEPPAEASLEDERTALAAYARSLGINVDGRWGIKRLRDEIDAVQSL